MKPQKMDSGSETACPPHHDIDKCAGVDTCSLHLSLAVEAEVDK